MVNLLNYRLEDWGEKTNIKKNPLNYHPISVPKLLSLTPLFPSKEACLSHLSRKQSVTFKGSVAFKSHAQTNKAATLS